jgi:hypothetical protein
MAIAGPTVAADAPAGVAGSLGAYDARRFSLSYPQGWNLMLHISDFFS